MYKDENWALELKASHCFSHRELEKQNDILLSATLERLYAGDAKIIQSLVTPGLVKRLGALLFRGSCCENSLDETYLEELRKR